MSQKRPTHGPEPAQGEGPLPSRENKVAYVRALFARIAPRYDRMNRLMTLGFDRRWRRLAVREALRSSDGAPPGRESRRKRALDVATGTGDLAIELLHQDPSLNVVGLDLVPEMLGIAKRKAGEHLGHRGPADGGREGSLELVVGDALHLPFPDGDFDAVVTGFAMRNVLDIPAAYREMARVTRMGGRIACLELAKPRLPVFRQLYGFYFFWLVPLLGRIMAGEAAAYTYLPHSLSVFLTPDEIVEVMRSVGWRDVRYRRLMLGTVALHVGVKG